MTDYSKYTDAELRQAYKDRYEEYKTWWNSQDGSDGAFWDYEIRPIYEEARRRGIDL